MPNDLPAIDTTSTYALIASLVAFTVFLFRKATPGTWAKIPPRWRWVVPVLVAGGMAFAEAQQSGRPWKYALLGAIGAGLAASGGHHALSDSPLPYGNAALLLVVLSLGATGCTGSLETARATGRQERKVGAMAAPAGSPERCSTLDDRHSLYGGISAAAATLAGVSGLSTIPLDDPDQRDLRTGVAAAGVGMAAIAAGALFVSQQAASTWSKECASH